MRVNVLAIATVVLIGISALGAGCAAPFRDRVSHGPAAFCEIDALPLLRTGVQTHQFSSYDRAGDNYDHEYFTLYVEKSGECVIFDAMGPGCLYRQQMNIWMQGHGYSERNYKDIFIRYYFDDEAKPRIDMDASTFFSARNPLGIFRSPLAVDGGEKFRTLYTSMFFKKRLKVSLSREPGGGGSDLVPWTGRYDKHPKRRNHWYSYTYHLFAEDPGLPSWTPRQGAAPSAPCWEADRLGRDPKPLTGNREITRTAPLPAGRSLRIAEVQGAGSIASFRLSLDPLDPNALFDTWLRITWDGRSAPDVEAPVGCFFGAYRTAPKAAFSALLLGYSPSGMYCYLPMPFWTSAQIELENRGRTDVACVKSQIHYKPAGVLAYHRERCGYFHARYHRESPRTEGRDYTYLTANGAGHVVGHTVFRWETSMEENERTYFDGSRTPQIEGTGFEDDHNMGWGLADRVHAVFGAVGSKGGEGAIYRFFVPDLYVFQSGIKHGHQAYGPHSPLGHEGMYKVGREESVTFYYAADSPRMVLTDELDVGSPDSEKAHDYVVDGRREEKRGAYWYDGKFNSVLFQTPMISDDGVTFQGSSRFSVKTDPANRGVRLRRRTDKENNRQLARVYVDGRLVTERPWYTVDIEKTYKNIRWLDTDFDIPARYTRGKGRITVKIKSVDSETGQWEEYRYWVYSRR